MKTTSKWIIFYVLFLLLGSIISAQVQKGIGFDIHMAYIISMFLVGHISYIVVKKATKKFKYVFVPIFAFILIKITLNEFYKRIEILEQISSLLVMIMILGFVITWVRKKKEAKLIEKEVEEDE